MELKLRHWIMTVMTLCGVVAVRALPPEPVRQISVRRESPVTPERRIAQRYRNLVGRIEVRLWTIQMFDHLRRVAAESDAALAMEVGGEFDPGLAEDVQTSAESSFESLGALADGAGGGVALVQPPPGQMGRYEHYAVHYFEFDVVGGHRCFATYAGTPNIWLRPRRYFRVGGDALEAEPPSPLGACWVPLRYGPAGPAIADWFQSYGAAFAQPTWADWPGINSQRYVFGLDPEERGCLAGRVELCAKRFRGGPPDGPAREADERRSSDSRFPGHFRVRMTEPLFDNDSHSVLRDLETQFGPFRFRQFWTSQESFDDAFQAAFGMEAGEWVYQWATSRWGRTHRGPRMSVATYLWILVVIALCTVWTVYRERSKTVPN